MNQEQSKGGMVKIAQERLAQVEAQMEGKERLSTVAVDARTMRVFINYIHDLEAERDGLREAVTTAVTILENPRFYHNDKVAEILRKALEPKT